MTFEEYQTAVEYAQENNPTWRKGQAAFNVLMCNREDLSERVRGTPLDPYYNDTILNEFYHWVREHWDSEAAQKRKAQR